MKKTLMLLLALCLMMTVCSAAFAQEEKPVLTMGTNAEFPPYEYFEDQKIVGIDAEIAAAIAEKLGMTIDIKHMDFNAIITAVDRHEVDMGMAGLTVSEERLQSVNFTTPYATGVQVVIVKEDSPIATLDDLFAEGAAYVVGVQEATTGDIFCTDDFGEERVAKYKAGADAVAALTTGKVDLVVIDNEPAKVFVEKNEGLKILETEYAVEDYAIAVAMDNTELLDKFNAALEERIADGTVAQSIGKYISAE